MTTEACKGAAKRLLKCFCGCGALTEEEVQRIYRLSAQATLIDRPANKLLHKYFEKERSGDKGEPEQLLDVYEKCGEYMMQDERLLTLDELDELSDAGMPYHLEKDLKSQIQTGDKSNIERCLMRIQGECRNEIEDSEDYKAFKQALLNKLKNKA